MKVRQMLVGKMMKEEEGNNIMVVSDTSDRFHFPLFIFFMSEGCFPVRMKRKE